MTTPSDDELAQQIDAIAEVSLEDRAEALDKASEALRALLDSTD